MIRIILLLLCFSGFARSEAPLRLYAGNTDIYCYQQAGQFSGIACALVEALARTQGIEPDINMLPQGRMLIEGQKASHALLFPVARVPHREKHFQWVVLLVEEAFLLVAPAGSTLPVNDIDQLTDVSIGVLLGGLADQLLSQYQHLTLVRNHNESNLTQQLIKGRFKVWGGPWNVIYNGYRKAGKDAYQLTLGQVFQRTPIYIAASLDVSAESIQSWQRAFDQLKATGQYEHILKRYDYQPPPK